jgi:hypothetical protein
MRTLSLTLLVGILLLFADGPVWADQCPNLPATGNEVNGFVGCTALVTINPDGSATVTFNPQSDVEDTLVGVQNNSASPLAGLHILGEEPFQFDEDFGLNNGPTGYEGPGVSFTGIALNGSSGDVLFKGGIPAGGTGWFALEGAANSENIAQVTPTPEPGTMMLLGSGLIGLVIRRRSAKR